MGLSFDAIAAQITRVGRGQAQPMVATSEPITFPPDYQISRQACHKAFKKAVAREPSLELEELRNLDNARSEEMWMSLQPAIRKGNVRAVEVGIKVLEHRAKINGYEEGVTVNTQNNINLLQSDPTREERSLLDTVEAVKILRDLNLPGVREILERPSQPLPEPHGVEAQPERDPE
jgi:hypothetical protein